jgi:hypothetical protein
MNFLTSQVQLRRTNDRFYVFFELEDVQMIVWMSQVEFRRPNDCLDVSEDSHLDVLTPLQMPKQSFGRLKST